MRAGKLRHRLTLQSPTGAVDATFGGQTHAYTDTATVWGSVEPAVLMGREQFAAAQLQAELTHRITIRYRAGVTPKMRVSWDSRTFDIEQVVNVEERDRELHLLCREMTPA